MAAVIESCEYFADSLEEELKKAFVLDDELWNRYITLVNVIRTLLPNFTISPRLLERREISDLEPYSDFIYVYVLLDFLKRYMPILAQYLLEFNEVEIENFIKVSKHAEVKIWGQLFFRIHAVRKLYRYCSDGKVTWLVLLRPDKFFMLCLSPHEILMALGLYKKYRPRAISPRTFALPFEIDIHISRPVREEMLRELIEHKLNEYVSIPDEADKRMIIEYVLDLLFNKYKKHVLLMCELYRKILELWKEDVIRLEKEHSLDIPIPLDYYNW